MGYAVGIDLGSTTAKFTAKGERGLASQSRPAIRQEALVGRGLEAFLAWAGIGREEVERVVLTGVRTAAFTHSVLGLPTCTVPEFEAIGRGGLALSDGLEEALVVSLGTGTALVMAGPEGCAHLGGSGMGGGTLTGLGMLLLGERNPARIGQLAARGRADQVDLMMRDLYDGDLPTLSRELTAANFGHISPEARREDIALGLVTMILQSAGLAASFTLRGKEVRDVVLTGSLTQLPQAEEQFAFMSRCFGLNFRIPGELAPYATALGAVLCPPQACTWLRV